MKDLAPPANALRTLASTFGDEPSSLQQVATKDQVRQYLIGKIAALLAKNPGRLMSILYRIDVHERHVKHAFDTAPPGLLPETLADLIITRQMQKLKYRNGA